MMGKNKKVCAALIATTSTALLAGAVAFQSSGLPPCEMCMWQRWPHAAAAVLAAVALLESARATRILTTLAAACIAASGLIGVYHAGVEWKFWEGMTTCSVPYTGKGGDMLTQMMNAPVVRCDEAAWRMFGISMAGYNAIISLVCTAAVVIMMRRREIPEPTSPMQDRQRHEIQGKHL